MTDRERLHAENCCRFPWKRLEIEEQAFARRMMGRGVLRLAFVPYAPNEQRLEFVEVAS